MIRIAHASIDENGKAHGGKAGDQTGKEVCIRTWYSKPWDFVLRCKKRDKAELMAQACEDICNNPNIGYDQYQRNTLKHQALLCHYIIKSIKTPCGCDCSSMMTVCAECAGIAIPYNSGNAPTTSTMKTAFTKTGEFEVLTDKKYTTKSEYLLRGDILVKAGCHTVMVLDNGELSGEQPKKKYQYGIDISQNQGSINWDKVKEAGIEFVCLRSTKKSFNTDTIFMSSLAACKSLHIDYSCYKYAYAENEIKAIAEADSVINLLKKVNTDMTIWYDFEDPMYKSMSKSQCEKIIMAFINRCNLAGYKVGIYTYDSMYKTLISDMLKKNFMFWISRYGKNDGTLNENYKPSADCYAWQYTSKGRVNGINGNVDLDVIL